MTVDLVLNIPFFSILTAMFAGIITSPIRRGKIAYRLSVAMVSLSLVMSVILLYRLSSQNMSYTFMMGHFPAPWGNELKAGPLEALMATLFSAVMLLSLLGGKRALFEDVLPQKQNLYFIMINLLHAAMLALIYTNDLFTAYVFIEISTLAACALIMAKDSSRSLVATTRYLIMMLLGSGLFLFGSTILYTITGHLLMENLYTSLGQLVEAGKYVAPLRIVVGMIVIGVCIKSALFPFHTMLPGAHSVATPTSSALLSSLVLKAFIILLIKLYFRVFGLELMANLGINHVLFVFAVLAMILCSLMALKESDLKRMIAYSSAAQIGYIYLGISLCQTGGMQAACFHILAHSLTKSMLFICAGGLINASGHMTDIHALRGAASRNRLAAIGFTMGGLSLIGVPLLPGFVSKLYLAQAAMGANPALLALVLAVLIGSMVLNALYFVPAIIAIWSKPADGGALDEAPHPAGAAFGVSVITLMALNVLLGVFFQPVLGVINAGLELL